MSGGAEVVSTGRGGVGVLDRLRELMPGSGGDYEDLFEVCCKFLDERFPGDRIDGHGTDHHVDRKGEEEEREFRDEHGTGGDYEQLRADAEWDYSGRYGSIYGSYNDDGCCRA
jgi:hypothetical protein